MRRPAPEVCTTLPLLSPCPLLPPPAPPPPRAVATQYSGSCDCKRRRWPIRWQSRPVQGDCSAWARLRTIMAYHWAPSRRVRARGRGRRLSMASYACDLARTNFQSIEISTPSSNPPYRARRGLGACPLVIVSPPSDASAAPHTKGEGSALPQDQATAPAPIQLRTENPSTQVGEMSPVDSHQCRAWTAEIDQRAECPVQISRARSMLLTPEYFGTL
eukprot:COSAG06_NODE_2437_length_6877_cov_6.719976_6_plen_217_part_00